MAEKSERQQAKEEYEQAIKDYMKLAEELRQLQYSLYEGALNIAELKSRWLVLEASGVS